MDLQITIPRGTYAEFLGRALGPLCLCDSVRFEDGLKNLLIIVECDRAVVPLFKDALIKEERLYFGKDGGLS